jgi:hypothetical protein
MIALTDQALAQLVIGATRLPPRSRARWLRAFAREADQDPAFDRGVSRVAAMRRYRARQKRGRSCYLVELDNVRIEALLEHEGLLPPRTDHTRKDVERALQRLLEPEPPGDG